MKRPLQLRRRLVRMALMFIVCIPSLLLSSSRSFDAHEHRQLILAASAVIALVLVLWLMDRYIPLARKPKRRRRRAATTETSAP